MDVKNVHAVIGSSLGGMQALQFVVEFPDVSKKMINISSTSHTSPGTVAIRRIQRLAVISDPKYHGGKYHENSTWPSHGMKVARTVGLLSYRSVSEFNDRFGWKPRPPYDSRSVSFEVEKWLDEKTEPFASNFDPNCYLLLSRCMDLMDIGMTHKSTKDAVSRIKASCLILGATTDTLIYPKEQNHMAAILRSNGIQTKSEIVETKYGHDGFLHDIELFGGKIKSFIEE
jgi:homoserine O-acetyltransferase